MKYEAMESKECKKENIETKYRWDKQKVKVRW